MIHKVLCFRRSSLASVLHTCLGVETVSPVAFLCIQMAGPTKRLRRKMTVSHSDCSVLLMLTSEFWLQFAFPAGRYLLLYDKPRRQVIKWRLHCKAWREVWDQGWRVTLRLPVDNLWMLYQAAQCYGDVLFVRDKDNEVIYRHQMGRRRLLPHVDAVENIQGLTAATGSWINQVRHL